MLCGCALDAGIPAESAAASSRLLSSSAHTCLPHVQPAQWKKLCRLAGRCWAGPCLMHCCVQVCNVTCCGLPNFEQHCASKRHLRKLAVAGMGAVEGGPASSGSSPQVGCNPCAAAPTGVVAALPAPEQLVQQLAAGPCFRLVLGQPRSPFSTAGRQMCTGSRVLVHRHSPTCCIWRTCASQGEGFPLGQGLTCCI